MQNKKTTGPLNEELLDCYSPSNDCLNIYFTDIKQHLYRKPRYNLHERIKTCIRELKEIELCPRFEYLLKISKKKFRNDIFYPGFYWHRQCWTSWTNGRCATSWCCSAGKFSQQDHGQYYSTRASRDRICPPVRRPPPFVTLVNIKDHESWSASEEAWFNPLNDHTLILILFYKHFWFDTFLELEAYASSITTRRLGRSISIWILIATFSQILFCNSIFLQFNFNAIKILFSMYRFWVILF